MAALVALGAAAHAQAPLPSVGNDTLLLIRTAGDDGLCRRIEGELAATDWSIVQLGPDPELERAPLSDLARARGALAALRMDAERGELSLWVQDAQPAADGSTDVLSAEGMGDGVLAMRAVETLRARTLALRHAVSAGEPEPAQPEPPAAEPPPKEPEATRQRRPANAANAEEVADADTADAKDAAPPPEPPLPHAYPGLWLELAPALAYSPGGLAASLDGWLGLRVQPAARWSLASFALVPLWSSELQSSEGSASVSTLLLGAGAFVQLIRVPIELGLGAGLGGAFMFTSGHARAPNRSSHDTAFAPAPFASPSLHVHLGKGLRAYARGLIGATLPELTLRFASSDVAHWGKPFVAGMLGLELAVLGR